MTTAKADLHDLYAHSDRIQLMVLVLLFLFSLLLANWHDTWGIAFLVGLPTLLIPAVLILTTAGTLASRLAVAVAYMVFAGLHIQQGQGMIELHFGIFGLLAFLLYYRDWLVIIVAALVIAIHHILFNYLQAQNLPFYVFKEGSSWSMVFTHAAYVIFESGFLVYMAIESHREARRNLELKEIGKHFIIEQGMINLTYRQANADSDFAHSFNTFMTTVNEAVGKSKQVAERLISASDELQILSANTREGTELEKMNSTHIASAINQMAETLQTVAQNAREAAEAASQAENLVSSGSDIIDQTIKELNELVQCVEQASSVIQELESHSSNIGMVLDVIKSIAEQTNLLALNAAIEAARAGEQGRGFAVVADEVRTLASRTQKSTQDIQTMIEQLQIGSKNAARVMSHGSEQAQQVVLQSSRTREAFGSIAESVAIINTMNAQIANAGEQQSVVVDDIQDNINKITSIATETTQDAGSLDTLTHDLGVLAKQLKQLVDKFNV